MFSCKEVADRASLLVDGELSTWQMMKMRLHLAMCGACSKFVAQISITRDLVKASGETNQLNRADIAAVHARIRDSKPPT